MCIEGSIDHNQVMLNTVGADMARGALTGVARRNADGSWVVENLRLNDVRLQSDKSLSEFSRRLLRFHLCRLVVLEVTDSSLQGPDWAVTDLDLSLRNLTLRKEDWQSQEGKLSMNASEFITAHCTCSINPERRIFTTGRCATPVHYPLGRRYGQNFRRLVTRRQSAYSGRYRYRRAGVYAAGKLEAVMDEAAARLVEQPDAEKIQRQPQSGD